MIDTDSRLNPFGRDDDPYADMDDEELLSAIERSKDAFVEHDIDDAKTEMYQLAKDLADLNGELAARADAGPTSTRYEEAATKWDDIADLVIEGTDPTEQLQDGGGDHDADIEQFRYGIPEASFDDVGGYEPVKQRLFDAGLKPMQYRDFLQGELGQTAFNGLVLAGPPGTGKTLMAKAFAGELHARLDDDVTLYKVKPNQLKEGVRGESGKLMRALFTAATRSQPAVLVFEEIDTLVPRRDDPTIQSMQSDRDLVASFLDEINEIDSEDVVCLGTTNRADSLDTAAVRSGRLKEVQMGEPDVDARHAIFRLNLDKVDSRYVADDIAPREFAERTAGATGADIEYAVDSALRKMGIEYKEGER